MALLSNYPKLFKVTEKLDEFLRKKHPEFFGKSAFRPFSPLKSKKVIHDAIWGTFSFSWRELAVLDTPLIQRLRDIHQIGLAYLVYPSARHTRLEHSLGVMVMASRIFDSLALKHRGILRDCVRVVFEEEKEENVTNRIEQLKAELRLAALLHDVGHSLHSHASERVYSKLGILKEAAEELSDFTGKRKGVGEVISFCFTLAPCLEEFLSRSRKKVLVGNEGEVYRGEIDLQNVALMIVGRTKHPFLQFLGDIISSDIDADKLDYLLRDSTSAGLPLRYDVDMFLYSAQLELDVMADGEKALQKLYQSVGTKDLERQSAGNRCKDSFYDAYRLCLPKRAMHVLEQIVICKMMLFSYVYHHAKVRAAEGLLERMLDVLVNRLKLEGKDEWAIFEWFLEATDADLIRMSDDDQDPTLKESAYRLVNRLLPREIFRLSAAEAVGAQKPLLANFLKGIRDKEKGQMRIMELEKAMGEELVQCEGFRGMDWMNALMKAGAWLDVPKAPSFEDTQKVISKAHAGREHASSMFPVHAWQHAYTSHRCYVRIFAHSEFCHIVKECAKTVMKRIVRIEDDMFYQGVERARI